MPRERWFYAAVAPVLAAGLMLSGCSRGRNAPESRQSERAATNAGLPDTGPGRQAWHRDAHLIRATGVVRALEWQSIRVPHMSGVGGFEMVLTKLIPNGASVSKGDVLVEFDRLNLLDQERDAVALLEDLAHQLDERKAQVDSLQATRGSQIRETQADLERAALQLRKKEVLSDIDRMKNEAKVENAQLRLDRLKQSDTLRGKAEQASIRILELKHQRQQVTLERLRTNLDRLLIKAPQSGMVAYENTWRQGSMGPPQVGDRMWPGMPVVRIFNPARMVVQATVDEPDFASVSEATRARVYLDAYPGELFDATLESASPVATAGLDSPVRNFVAIFNIKQQSPRLLPDLSAALEIDPPSPHEGAPHKTAPVETAGRVPPQEVKR
ncbi:MAG TPA: HlyD family efflux transporter periplasmic adaptor subunit [Bryobacteraceae bacterium]|nr:HlyD family efflux transporter periplasmic adaptor subunit [Bryobacteraceae bacterium]